MKLTELEVGASGMITDIQLQQSDKKRLFYIGLYEGAYITKLQKAPIGDPTLYFVLGNQIILRNKDAQKIHVEVKE